MLSWFHCKNRMKVSHCHGTAASDAFDGEKYLQTLLWSQARQPLALCCLPHSDATFVRGFCAAAEAGNTAAYGTADFSDLAPGSSHSASLQLPAVLRPERVHRPEAGGEQLQQAQLQAELQQLRQLRQQHRDVLDAARGQAVMPHLLSAAAVLAAQHQLAAQLAGHGALLPPAQQHLQHAGCMPGDDQAAQQAGSSMQTAAARAVAGFEHSCRQAAAMASAVGDINWQQPAGTAGTNLLCCTV